MYKNKIIIVLILITGSVNIAWSQVGINTTMPAGVFHIDAKGNNLTATVDGDDVVVNNQGRMGIGMNPIYGSKLQIKGGITIKDGTQGAGKILTSDASGNASWSKASAYTEYIKLTALGVDIPYNTTGYLQSGTSFLIPPGRYAVNISMVFRFASATPIVGSFVMLRASLSNSSSATSAIPSTDLENNILMGEMAELTNYGFITGTLIVKNSTATSKRYYLIGGNITSKGITGAVATTNTIYRFGGHHYGENNIVIYKLSD